MKDNDSIELDKLSGLQVEIRLSSDVYTDSKNKTDRTSRVVRVDATAA